MEGPGCDNLSRVTTADIIGARNALEDWPDGGDHVVPDAAVIGPGSHVFCRHARGVGDINSLPLADFLRQSRVLKEDVILVIQIEAAQIQVG